MTIQVWKPEFEHPGRHFVYTTRYVYFFVSLLCQLGDRAGLDQLLRRVRKRQGDFFNHTKLWEDICIAYFKVRAVWNRSSEDLSNSFANRFLACLEGYSQSLQCRRRTI